VIVADPGAGCSCSTFRAGYVVVAARVQPVQVRPRVLCAGCWPSRLGRSRAARPATVLSFARAMYWSLLGSQYLYARATPFGLVASC
jgi:hypothetical protein